MAELVGNWPTKSGWLKEKNTETNLRDTGRKFMVIEGEYQGKPGFTFSRQ
ncbi:MAG: hypothetical protein ACLPT6_00765 [Desulfobaccales bacterium]